MFTDGTLWYREPMKMLNFDAKDPAIPEKPAYERQAPRRAGSRAPS